MGLKQHWVRLTIVLTIFALSGTASAITLQPSVFDEGLSNLRSEFSTRAYEERGFALADELESDASNRDWSKRTGYKSPAKAFALSLAVPGLGQYYYGSRIKPFLFLGAEISTWVLHLKWHNQADDMTADFQAMADAYWNETDYAYYLTSAYNGIGDDDSLSQYTEIGHHLPDTRTQQYYEMIGKYDQFSWGWADSYLVYPDSTLREFDEHPPRVTGPAVTPTSALREQYETLRDDANQRYDRANKMIVVAIVNRLFSAFEAYIVTRNNNKKVREAAEEFGSIQVRAHLKSYSALHDTPFLKVSYSF